MKKPVATPHDSVKRALAIWRLLLRDYHPRDFAISFWDASRWPAETTSPRFTLVLNRPDALKCLLKNSGTDLAIGEPYMRGDLDLEGNLEATIPVANHSTGRRLPISTALQLGWNLFRPPANGQSGQNGRLPAKLSGRLHSAERDRQAVTYHYNLSNDFYALWLDERMVYLCAYFKTDEEELDMAQVRKLDYLCRKLRLRPSERLLDIGCGWGGLIIHAAQQYGVEALGITLSRNQAELANERLARAGLDGRCRVEVRDYRDLNDSDGFDKLVSVGMFEHVGESKLPRYFEHAWELLRPGGVFLNHGIALRASEPQPNGPTSIVIARMTRRPYGITHPHA